MFLNKSQAEAAYSAMVALNNVGAQVAVWIRAERAQDDITIENLYGDEVVIRIGIAGKVEKHADQLAFAAAYGIN